PVPWPLALGDAVRFPARVRSAAPARNPGGRDAALRAAASGVAGEAFATGPPVRVAPPSPLARLEEGRRRFAAAASAALPPREAGVVRAIGTGDRGGLDRPTSDLFARSGLAHVLAVSGLHLVVVAFGLERLVRAILLRVDLVARRADPRRLAAAIALPASALYALATGAGAPVLRAALAAALSFAGTLLDRDAAPVDALALAALVLLGLDPGAILDASLQLSFAAVLGIVLWAGRLRGALPVAPARRGTFRARLLEPLLAGGCASVAAAVATAPVLALHFRQLPLLGILVNVPAVPLGSLLTIVASLAAVLGACAPGLAAAPLAVAGPLAAGLLRLADLGAAPAWATLAVASPGPAGAAASLTLLVLAGRARRARRALLAAAALGVLLLPGPARHLAARVRGGLEVTFVGVGQGDAVLLRLPDGAAVLVDGGGAPGGTSDPGARDVVPLLRDLGIRRLAAVFVSHPHPDHVLGLAAVAAAFPIERTFTNGDPGAADAAAVLAALPAPAVLAPGDAWTRGGVRFEIVGGPRDGLGTNDASLVLRVVHGDVAFLLPGDVEGEGERRALAAGGLAAQVVKIPHHASRTSSSPAFVAATGARWAVACVGRDNRFGFPHPEIIARWRAAGAEVLRTDEGAVQFLSDGRTVRRVPASATLDPLATWRERP
ncbi:MAG TPA: DNA internalization-related competence protein ComEC/Rec2, partial [Anaeromyxobacteraceae bacterium]|nr:DNA internalization-related competence protein ComEC/Rec2 [Anaeromyxobacteraceae bacterium]